MGVLNIREQNGRAMSLIALKCPNCNGDLEFDDSREFGFCQFCGTKVLIQKDISNIHNTFNTVVNEGRDEQHRRMTEAAKRAIDAKSYGTALELAEHVVSEDPTVADAHLVIALSLTLLRKRPDAGARRRIDREHELYRLYSGDGRTMDEILEALGVPVVDEKALASERLSESRALFRQDTAKEISWIIEKAGLRSLSEADMERAGAVFRRWMMRLPFIADMLCDRCANLEGIYRSQSPLNECNATMYWPDYPLSNWICSSQNSPQLQVDLGDIVSNVRMLVRIRACVGRITDLDEKDARHCIELAEAEADQVYPLTGLKKAYNKTSHRGYVRNNGTDLAEYIEGLIALQHIAEHRIRNEIRTEKRRRHP